MDDIKFYGKDMKEIDSMMQTVRVYSEDICIEKCAVVMKG